MSSVNKTTTIQISIATHDKLYKLKKLFEGIFKKNITFDQLIEALLVSKVNLDEELI